MLRYLAARPELELTVFFLSDMSVRGYRDAGFGVTVQWDVPLVAGYDHVFLPCWGGRDRVSFWRPFVYGLGRRLQAGGFDALWLHGYAHQANLRALACAKALGIPVLLRGESHLGSTRRGAWKLWLKRRVMPRLFRAIDAFLAIGTLNRQYYRHYGVPDERIFSTPYAVDNDFFQSRVAAARPRREALRAELKLGAGRPVILCVSKLYPGKRPGDLLEAYRGLSPDGRHEPTPVLVFVGDGEERPRLEARARRLGWSSVRFLGFRNQSELPRFYDLADMVVLPSAYETWGLVVNEAMNAARALIVTDRVGAAADLVEDGRNGFVVPVGDVGALSDRLRVLTEKPDLARAMGQESHRRISRWSFEADLAGLLASLEATITRRSARRVTPRG